MPPHPRTSAAAAFLYSICPLVHTFFCLLSLMLRLQGAEGKKSSASDFSSSADQQKNIKPTNTLFISHLEDRLPATSSVFQLYEPGCFFFLLAVISHKHFNHLFGQYILFFLDFSCRNKAATAKTAYRGCKTSCRRHIDDVATF